MVLVPGAPTSYARGARMKPMNAGACCCGVGVAPALGFGWIGGFHTIFHFQGFLLLRFHGVKLLGIRKSFARKWS